MKMNKALKGLLFLTFAAIIVFPNEAIVANAEENIASNTSIPSSYDGRDYGYVTAVEDQDAQGETGTCWAQAATTSAEMSYIINQGYSIDPSSLSWNPYHLTYFAYNNPTDPLNLFGGDYTTIPGKEIDAGGSGYKAISAFANWIGPSSCGMTVNNVNNDTYLGNTSYAFSHDAHLRNGYSINFPAWNQISYGNYDESQFYVYMENVKEIIMKYGSACLSYAMLHDEEKGYWKDNAYQYKDTAYQPFHAVSVIGWDDNIGIDKFGINPPKKGAWLIQNSYGTDFGDNGYFWLSYYDMSIYHTGYAYDVVSNKYDNNYQYDGTSGFDRYEVIPNSNTISAANAFVADSYETLKAVGFYTTGESQNYEVRIYKNLSEDSLPQNGVLVHTQPGTQKYKGFHTIDLTTSIDISKGERYAIVITLTDFNAINGIGFAVDKKGGDMSTSFYPYAKRRQSYLGTSVNNLKDLNPGNVNSLPGSNVRIKAFTNEKNGLYEESSGNILYLRDGNIVTSKTTYFKYENEWYYMKNGVVDSTFDGVAADAAGALWYLENSKVDFSKYGLYKRGNYTYYFIGGKVQSTYNGLVSDSNGDKWFVENGVVQTNKYGVFKCGTYSYYFIGGKVLSTFDGVASDSNGNRWYIENGVVQTNKNGFYERGGNWYYFKGGKVFSTCCLLPDANGTLWYVSGGKLDFTFDGVAFDSNGNRWYVENGRVDTTKNGLWKRSNNWYYFIGGKVQSTYTNLVADAAGTYWYVKSGKVDFTYNGTIIYQGWPYKVVNGKATRI